MKWMRAAAVVGAVLILAGCDAGEDNSRIKLGAILSGTGALANTGSVQIDAAVLAAEEINAHGGVLGSKLVLVWRDDASDPEKAREAARSMLAQKVVAVIGAAGSEQTLAAAGVLAASKKVLVSGGATATALTDAKDKGYLFRTCASDAFQGRLLAKRAAARKLQQVAVIHAPGKFGSAMAEQFDAAFNAAGGSISSEWTYLPGQPDYVSMLSELYMWGLPEGVLLVGYPTDSAQILKDYVANFSHKKSVFYFPSTLQDSAFLRSAGPGTFVFEHEGTGPGAPAGERYQTFVDAFQRRFGEEPGPYAANVYDAVYLLALAIEATGSTDGELIKDALIDVSIGGVKYGPESYPDAVEAVREGKGINYEGASGAVDFDDQGDVMAPFDVWKIADGELRVVERSVTP